MRSVSLASLLAILVGATASSAALAWTTPQTLNRAAIAKDGIRIFTVASFADASPANAYDMVKRLPGFVLVEADADVRGYAGAQGNVLIDGAWPTSKREDTSDLLKRIPAAAVARIELIASGATDIDMGGYAMVANVVRRTNAPTRGTVKFGAVASTDGWMAPSGQWQWTHQRDGRSLDLSLKIEPELDDDSGRGTVTTITPDGAIRTSALATRVAKHKAEASAAWQQTLAGGQLTLTGARRGERARTDTRITADADDDSELVHEQEDTRDVELGARYRRDLGEHAHLQVMATHQRGQLDDREHAREDDAEETFDENTHTGEDIQRVDLNHAWSDALSMDASLEHAFNFLHSRAHLRQQGQDADVPGSNANVEERRMEGAIGITWKPDPRWTLDAGLRIEQSSIAHSGDTALTRHFVYPKPRLAARWDAGQHDQLRLSLSREVGQLDFGDFVASASLDTDVVSAGNANLQPEQTWRLTTAWEHQFGSDAALTLTWTHERIDDVVDRVLVTRAGEVFDAPGNIGSGQRDSLQWDLGLPLDALGLPGGRIRSTLTWSTSRVTDPVTGRARRISGEKPLDGDIELTQDLPAQRAQWGITLEHIGERKTKYRFNQIERETEATGWTLFLEKRLGNRWRVRAEATDLFGRSFTDTRVKYDGARPDAPLRKTERRERRAPGTFSLTFQRTLGG